MADVSVAMCTFDGERFLAEQLDSLAAQTLPPREIVVCDDGSGDGTEAVVRAFAARSPVPVRWSVNARRLGYRQNFMHAGGLCAGALVAFCDQDDVWRPDKLERATRPFAADPAATLTYHAVDLMDERGRPLGPYRDRAPPLSPFDAESCDPWLFGLGFTLVFRRELLDHGHLRAETADFNGRGAPLAHDQWLFFLASVLGRVHYLEEPLASYRQHGANLFGARVEGDGLRMPYQGRMRHRYERNADHRAACEALVRVLPGLADPADPGRARRIDAAAARHAALAKRFERSMSLCERRAVPFKLWQVLHLALEGCYGAGPRWSFEDRYLSRDLLACFAAGPFEPEAAPAFAG